METKALPGLVLLFVITGMILGIGILVYDQFGQVTRVSTSVINESVAVSSGAGSLAFDNVTALSFFGNITVNDSVTGANVNFTSGGVLAVDQDVYADASYGVNYVFARSSMTTGVMGDLTGAVSPIGSTWLPLIVTVAVLALILTLVIGSFGAGRS